MHQPLTSAPVRSGFLGRLLRGGMALTAMGCRLLRDARDRRQLARLSDRQLADIGLARADIERELGRPFWQPVDWTALDRQRRRRARHLPLARELGG